MTFTIYASDLEKVQKRLDKLAVKAAGYSIPFAYHVGAEHPETVRVYDVDHVNHVQYVVNRYKVAAVDVTVDCEELIKANGWTLRAKVEHGDKGNIVTPIGTKPADLAWFTAPARCDHCKTNRRRSVTYFVEHKNGEIKQVGRACLHEYTGIAPATAALWAEVQDVFVDGMDRLASEWFAYKGEQVYDVTQVLAHACDVVKEFGYRKSDEPDSTREEVTKRVLSQAKPTAEALETAERIKTWLLGMSLTDESLYDLEKNCSVLAASGFAKTKHFGRLAYMPVAFAKYLERKAREERREAERLAAVKASEYVGAVGQRITLRAATAVLITSWEGNYGMTFLYKFVDDQGNVFIWYASRGIEVKDGMTLKATVKDHNEREGVKQTILTRCKLVA